MAATYGWHSLTYDDDDDDDLFAHTKWGSRLPGKIIDDISQVNRTGQRPPRGSGAKLTWHKVDHVADMAVQKAALTDWCCVASHSTALRGTALHCTALHCTTVCVHTAHTMVFLLDPVDTRCE
mmetsp:Transcript_39887/g.86082  ORF Transcript_39887/g.86082 Transcript_39887/m.86082 type:complete len:123 (+) Transcript_39887:383-751(+)